MAIRGALVQGIADNVFDELFDGSHGDDDTQWEKGCEATSGRETGNELCEESPKRYEDDGGGWSHKDRNGWVGKMEEKDKPGRN